VRDAQVVAEALTVTIENASDDLVSVDLSMQGMGLDRRSAWASIGQFALLANETMQVDVPLVDLPIQSVGAPGQIDLRGTSTGASWTDAQLATDSAYVQFTPDYQEAYVSTRSTWTPIVLGLVEGEWYSAEYVELRDDPVSALMVRDRGSVSTEVDAERARDLYERVLIPATRPRGRYLDEGGHFVDVVGDVVSGGMLVMESPHADLIRALEPFAQEQDDGNPPGRGPYILCAKYGASYLDAGKGETYLSIPGYQTHPASYARAEVRYPNGNTYWTGYLDPLGCTYLVNLPNGSYTFYVGWEQKNANEVKFQNSGDHPAIHFDWTFPFTATPLVGAYTFSTTDSPASRVHAVVALLYSTPDAGLTPYKTYNLWISTGNCDGMGSYSSKTGICYGYNPGPNPPHGTAYKMIIAHEIGHSVERDGAGLVKARYDHDVDPRIARCRCDHIPNGTEGHCLQSREHASDAWEEGFAHFYAAKLFNDPVLPTCYVGYYAQVRKYFPVFNLEVILQPPVKTSCRDPVKWMVSECNVPRDQALGTEWDWMTFLWSIHGPLEYGTKRITMADYYSIKMAVCGASIYSKCDETDPTKPPLTTYPAFRAAALAHFGGNPSNVKYKHIVDMAKLHGVDNRP